TWGDVTKRSTCAVNCMTVSRGFMEPTTYPSVSRGGHACQSVISPARYHRTRTPSRRGRLVGRGHGWPSPSSHEPPCGRAPWRTALTWAFTGAWHLVGRGRRPEASPVLLGSPPPRGRAWPLSGARSGSGR